MKKIMKYLKVVYRSTINLMAMYFTYIGLLMILNLLYGPKQIIINLTVFKNSFLIFLSFYTTFKFALYVNIYQRYITNYLIILTRKLKSMILKNN